MTFRRASFAFMGAVGNFAVSRPAERVRREPDAVAGKMFSNIHSNRERFSVAAVAKAFAKVPTGKID